MTDRGWLRDRVLFGFVASMAGSAWLIALHPVSQPPVQESSDHGGTHAHLNPAGYRSCEDLRALAQPPLPPDIDFSGCRTALEWAAHGMPSKAREEEFRQFASFGVHRQ